MKTQKQEQDDTIKYKAKSEFLHQRKKAVRHVF